MKGEVKRLRLQRGWTQAELADKAGVSRQSLNNIERGRTNASTTTLARLSRALGVPMETLLGVDTPKALVPVLLRELSAEDRRLLVELVASRDLERSASMVRHDLRNFAHLMRAAGRAGVSAGAFKDWFFDADPDQVREEFSPDQPGAPQLDIPEETTTLAAQLAVASEIEDL